MSMLPPLLPGEVLRDRYRILNAVGQGGMGSIYRAADQRLEGRITAIKEFHPAPTSSPELRERNRRQFQREASTLARLDHPNLPKVSDFFEEQGRDFLVMDFVPGHDLRQIIESAAEQHEILPANQVLAWTRQIATTLTYLHSLNPPVLHRDIKPSNIKLTPDGLIKLVDFGLVKVLLPDEEQTITVVQGRGSTLYTPLEQYGGDTGHTDIRSDIYAFGATLYHLFTNQPPASAKERFLNPRSLIPLQEINPDLPPRIVQTIYWALAMHPDDRPANVEQFYDTLTGNQIIPRIDHPTPAQTVIDPSNGIELAPNNSILAAVALVLLIIAIIVTLYTPIIEITP